ncbi:MAG: hypothetical protein AB7V77_05840 [Candidatus Woesearchaeota archaeon]
MAESKYSVLAEVAQKKLNRLENNTSDIVREKTIKAKIDRLEEKEKSLIAEVNNSEIDIDLIKQQLEIEKNSKIRDLERVQTDKLRHYEQQIERIKSDLKQLEDSKKSFENESKSDLEIKKNIIAKEFDIKISKLENSDNAKAQKIDNIKSQIKAEKEEYEIVLEELKIKNEANEEQNKVIDDLYNDLKELSKFVVKGNF